MYQFKPVSDGFFWFDKSLIKSLQWASLPKASKAIYPVLLMYANVEGISFPSEQTISILSGMTEKTVINGIHGLTAPEWIVSTMKYKVRYRTYGRRYLLNMPSRRQRRNFLFSRIVIEGGNWSRLIPSAQALYPAMRCFSFPDYDLYESMEHEEYSSKERRYDFCKTPPSELIQYAGIGKATFYRAIQSLINEYMIQEIADGFWKVYIRPQHWYKHEKLNEWTRKRFHYYRQ